MEDLISIIVPVYNSEQYLNDCIRSILQQSYSNFELILIDDGSRDESKNICLELCKTDKRIICLSQEHKGVSAARNAGLKIVKGKYIFFMDSDDKIHFELLESLYNLMKKTQSQISGCRYYTGKETDFERLSIVTADRNITDLYTYCDNCMALEYFIHGIIKELFALGGKMLVRDAIQKVQFDESLQNKEDTKFLYQLLRNGANIVVLDQYWYYYRKHEGGLSKTNSMKAWQSSYECERYICDLEKEAGRTQNAIVRENYIITCISDWYIKSKYAHDQILLKYVVQLMEQEKKLDIYSQSNPKKRFRFLLILHCYPLYWCIHRILGVLSSEYVRHENF